MAEIKKINLNFVDEKGVDLNKYEILNVDNNSSTIVKMVRKPTSITTVGTKLNAENMNSIINKINELVDGVNNGVSSHNLAKKYYIDDETIFPSPIYDLKTIMDYCGVNFGDIVKVKIILYPEEGMTTSFFNNFTINQQYGLDPTKPIEIIYDTINNVYCLLFYRWSNEIQNSYLYVLNIFDSFEEIGINRVDEMLSTFFTIIVE